MFTAMPWRSPKYGSPSLCFLLNASHEPNCLLASCRGELADTSTLAYPKQNSNAYTSPHLLTNPFSLSEGYFHSLCCSGPNPLRHPWLLFPTHPTPIHPLVLLASNISTLSPLHCSSPTSSHCQPSTSQCQYPCKLVNSLLRIFSTKGHGDSQKIQSEYITSWLKFL